LNNFIFIQVKCSHTNIFITVQYLTCSGFSGVLPQIVLCLKEQQQSLKLYALSALDEMAKNNEDLALKIVDVPTLPHVIIFLMPNFVDKKVQVYILQV